MVSGKFVAYYRVSTTKQGQSGLGLDAQRNSVTSYLNGGDWELIGEFEEVETGKGANALDKRPKLKEAIDQCKREQATLVIAKLDRLARNVHFISGLMETGVDFVAADMPQANKVMIQMHAVMSEWERDQISERTKAALAAAKAKGKQLGAKGLENLARNIDERQAAADAFAEGLRNTLMAYKAQGMSQRAIVAELNQLSIKTPSGKAGGWSLLQVQRVLARLRLSC
jgi:DNA invertase Pin-like site-specific DNA recombinase